jgi:Zn-dependent protease with chaperone function
VPAGRPHPLPTDEAIRAASERLCSISSGGLSTVYGTPLPREKSEGKLFRLNKMFDTHPPLDERIAALRAL